MTGIFDRAISRRASVVAVTAGLVCGVLTTGCEKGDTQSLGVSPGNATIGWNVARYTLAVVSGARDLSLPLEWTVTNPALGHILHSSGYYATYAQTGEVGVNTITVRDQYGTEGFAVVTQVAYETGQPATPVVVAPVTADTTATPATTSGTVLPASEFPGELSVANGEPSVPLVPGDVSIFNIERDLSGDAVAYDVTYNGQTYHYP